MRMRRCALAFIALTASPQSVLLADPPSTANPPNTTMPPAKAQEGSPPASEKTATPLTETVIKVQAQRQTPKATPQSNASQTALAAPAINHAASDLTLPTIIARFVPGASLNPDNGLRIRGADDQFQTYLDGVPLPQTVSGSISDVLDPKDIQSFRIYTGGFPTEFGNQLAGVFDITTRAGGDKPSGYVAQSAAGADSYVSRGNYGGSSGSLRYFVSATHRQTSFFLSPPTHDADNNGGFENHGFFHGSYTTNPNDRIILLLGANKSDFHNPGTPDTQQESGTIGDIIFNHAAGLADSKVALYSHKSTLRYDGSPADRDEGGLETHQNQQVTTFGLRYDQTLPLGAAHRLKAGLDISRSTVDQYFSVTLPDSGGNLTDDSGPQARNLGVYVQDDWTPGRLLINYGVRYDQNRQDITTNQVSPRINVKYRLTDCDTLHAYYDRLFQPIPVEDAAHFVGNAAIGDNGTVSPLQPERDNLYEVGIDHVQRGFSFGVAAYYKTGVNVRDDDQVGNTNITLPVDNAKAFFRGVEFTISGDFTPNFHAFGNLAISRNKNAGPITGGLNEGGVSSQYFYDDHDQIYTSNFGLAYERGRTFADLNGEYGSGQPYGETDDSDGDPTNLNYLRVRPHFLANFDVGRRFPSGFEATIFANNLFNDAYLIKQITLLSNTQYAQGRIIGLRLGQSF